MSDVDRKCVVEPVPGWNFRPHETFPSGTDEEELVQILLTDEGFRVWRLLQTRSGNFEIETNWRHDKQLSDSSLRSVRFFQRRSGLFNIETDWSLDKQISPVELPNEDIQWIYRIGHGDKRSHSVDRDVWEDATHRRIVLGIFSWQVRNPDLAPLSMSELASLSLELVKIRLSDDSLSIWTGGNRQIRFHSRHYPNIHDFMLNLLREHAHQDPNTQPLDVPEDIRKFFGDFDLPPAPEVYRLTDALYNDYDDYVDFRISRLTSAEQSQLSDVSPILSEFYERHERLKASAYRLIGIGEVLDALGKIDFQFRPESYWDPGTEYLRSGEIPAEREDVLTDEVKIAEISASLWWDGEEVGAETSYLTAYRLDDEFEISEEDVDDDEENTREDKIYYRIISSHSSLFGTTDLGYSDQPLTLQELIDLIYPNVEDVWSVWFTPEDHLVQHIRFLYSSDYYPQLEHLLLGKCSRER